MNVRELYAALSVLPADAEVKIRTVVVNQHGGKIHEYRSVESVTTVKTEDGPLVALHGSELEKKVKPVLYTREARLYGGDPAPGFEE